MYIVSVCISLNIGLSKGRGTVVFTALILYICIRHTLCPPSTWGAFLSSELLKIDAFLRDASYKFGYTRKIVNVADLLVAAQCTVYPHVFPSHCLHSLLPRPKISNAALKISIKCALIFPSVFANYNLSTRAYFVSLINACHVMAFLHRINMLCYYYIINIMLLHVLTTN